MRQQAGVEGLDEGFVVGEPIGITTDAVYVSLEEEADETVETSEDMDCTESWRSHSVDAQRLTHFVEATSVGCRTVGESPTGERNSGFV